MASFFPRRLTRAWPPILAALCVVSVARIASADPSSTTIAQGYEAGEIQSPRGVAMGDAQTALGVSTAAVYNNPANLPLARVYHFEGIAAYALEAQRQQYGGAIADSSTNRVAGGFGGTWSEMDPNGIHRSWADLRLAVAYPLGDMFSVGITGRYLRLEQSVGSGPLGPSLASDGSPGSPIFDGFTFDAGATMIPMTGLHISLLGKNLTVPNTSLAPTKIVGAVGYQAGPWSAEVDSSVDFNSYQGPRARYMAGGEYLIAERVPVRIGYRYDDGMKTHAASIGAGYIDKKWSVEIGVRRDLVADHPSTLGVIGFKFFYDQTGADESAEPL